MAKDNQLIARFDRIVTQLEQLIAKTDDPTAHRSTAVALLHHKISGASWTGFYFLRDGELVVDAYQGPVACLVLEKHTGVCWAAIDQAETVLVEDVHAFPGHIACDASSKSEVVVPFFNAEGKAIGVLDIDSRDVAHFTEAHRVGYEKVVRALERQWPG